MRWNYVLIHITSDKQMDRIQIIVTPEQLNE